MNENKESSCLLPPINDPLSSSRRQKKRDRFCTHLCLPSKAAILILFWTAAVGTAYYTVLFASVTFIDGIPITSTVGISQTVNGTTLYAILAIVMMLYPLFGFVADVHFGRLRVVVISLCFILGFAIMICFVEILVFATKLHTIFYNHLPYISTS